MRPTRLHPSQKRDESLNKSKVKSDVVNVQTARGGPAVERNGHTAQLLYPRALVCDVHHGTVITAPTSAPCSSEENKVAERRNRSRLLQQRVGHNRAVRARWAPASVIASPRQPDRSARVPTAEAREPLLDHSAGPTLDRCQQHDAHRPSSASLARTRAATSSVSRSDGHAFYTKIGPVHPRS